MALRKIYKKSLILQLLLLKIKFAKARSLQIPYVLALLRVRRIVANPCLPGKFYLNAYFKNVQTENSVQLALKYITTKLDLMAIRDLVKDNDVPAYVLAYKKILKKAVNLTEKRRALAKLNLAKKLGSPQNLSDKLDYYLNISDLKEDVKLSVESLTKFMPIGLFGPYKNYTEAEQKFQQSQYFDSLTQITQYETKQLLGIVGFLPLFQKVNYMTTLNVIYYILINLLNKKQKLQLKYIKLFTTSLRKYVLHNQVVTGIPSRLLSDIFTLLDKAESTVKLSVHKTLKDNRGIYMTHYFYDVTKLISLNSANQLTELLDKLVKQLQSMKKLIEDIEDVLLDVKDLYLDVAETNKNKDPEDYLLLNGLYQKLLKKLFNLIGGTSYQRTVLRRLLLAKGLAKNLNNPLDKFHVKFDPSYTQKMNTINKQLKQAQLQVKYYQKALDLSDYTNRTLLEELNKAKAKLKLLKGALDLTLSDNSIDYNLADSAAKEFIRMLLEYYQSLRSLVQDAKSGKSDYTTNFILIDNQATIKTEVRPESIPISFDFKCLKASKFKPDLDQLMQKIKKQYKISKVYKTDPDTGKLITPLIQVGLVYPDDWPYKNLYIDTSPINEWKLKVQELEAIKAKYSMFPLLIPAPEELQPSSIKTFGQGALTKVEVQPPPDPWCDKYFPKDYSLLIGVPSILPSLLTVLVLLFDKFNKPVMIKTKLLDKKGLPIYVQKTRKCPVSLLDGYIYVDTGITIKVAYTALPLLPNSFIIPGIGIDYGTAIAGYFTPLTPLSILLVKKYPYQNQELNGRIWWMMTDVAGTLAKLAFTDLPILTSFKVYIKYNLPCGYPKKCGKLTLKLMLCNGKCGLQLFLSKPLIIDPAGLGLLTPSRKKLGLDVVGAVMDKLTQLTTAASAILSQIDNLYGQTVDILDNKSIQGYQKIKESTMQLKSQTQNAARAAWKIEDVVLTNKLATDAVLNNFNGVLLGILPSLLDLIPPECRYLICESQRLAQKSDSIKTFGDSVQNAAKTAGNLATNMLNNVKNQLANAAEGMGNLATTAFAGAKNLASTFNLYQLCSRRFNDYLKDANPIGDASPVPMLNKNGFKVPYKLNLFEQLQNMLVQLVIGNLLGSLKTCATNAAAGLFIKNSPLIPQLCKLMLDVALKANNMVACNNILSKYGLSMDKVITMANEQMQNPNAGLNNLLPDGALLKGINKDQIAALSNNSVVNLNGVKVAANSLNSNAIGLNIKQNIEKKEKGDISVVTDAIKSNKEQLPSDGLTDLDIAANNLSKLLPNDSEAKKAIVSALGDNAKKLNNANVTKTLDVNNVNNLKDIQSTRAAATLQWSASASNTINDALSAGLKLKFAKSPMDILGGIGDIGAIIQGKMLLNILRGAADLAESQMSTGMQLLSDFNEYIKLKNDQLARLKKS